MEWQGYGGGSRGSVGGWRRVVSRGAHVTGIEIPSHLVYFPLNGVAEISSGFVSLQRQDFVANFVTLIVILPLYLPFSNSLLQNKRPSHKSPPD